MQPDQVEGLSQRRNKVVNRLKLRSSKKGFTLVELLVIIAITSIVGIILDQATPLPPGANCIIQKRQVYSAIVAYARDYNGRLPLACTNWLNYHQGQSTEHTWPVVCKNYLRLSLADATNWQRLRCPQDRTDPYNVWKPGTAYYWWVNWQRFVTPGYNYVYLSPISPDGKPFPVKLDSAATPSQTLMFAESCPDATAAGAPYGYWAVDPPTGEGSPSYYWYGGWSTYENGMVIARHNGAATVIWLDGHVTLSTISQLSDNSLWDLK
jgi:prepilin-type processing-associated H-X9-DG protein